jgi:predicted anti-sigma-YlaC factor YlaD
MSGHLSSEQISRWVMGEHGAPEEEHVRDCPECRAELARLESVLSQFQSSAQLLVGQAVPPVNLDFSSASKRSRRAHMPGRWVLAAATLMILVTVPLYQNARERQRAVAQTEADRLLLERVDRAVSRTVPRPMEPLIDLVLWGPGPEEGNEKNQ